MPTKIDFHHRRVSQLTDFTELIETQYGISRRILRRARAKLSRLGLIEHVSYLNSRHGGQHGWKLSSRVETALRQLAGRIAMLRDKTASSKDKEGIMLEFVEARRSGSGMAVTKVAFPGKAQPDIARSVF